MTPESSNCWWNPSTKLALFVAHQTLPLQEVYGVQHTYSSSGGFYFLAALHSLLTELFRRSTGEAVTPFQSQVIASLLCIANALHQFSPGATDRALCSLFGYIWQKLGSSIKQVIATVQTPLIHSRRECYILKQALSFQMSPSMSPNVTFLDFFSVMTV